MKKCVACRVAGKQKIVLCRNRFHLGKSLKDQGELEWLRLGKCLVWKIKGKVAQYLMMPFSYHSNATVFSMGCMLSCGG
jgi:hypothetical protein